MKILVKPWVMALIACILAASGFVFGPFIVLLHYGWVPALLAGAGSVVFYWGLRTAMKTMGVWE